MKCPILFTRAIPKFNTVLRIFGKKFSKFYGNSYRVNLIWMSGRVEDSSCNMKGVSDNNNVLDIMISDHLVYTTLNSKKLSLSYGNVSAIWFPDLNSLLKKEKEGKHWLHLSSTSIIDDLSQLLCLAIRWSMNSLWLLCSCVLSKLRMLWMMWLDRREDCCSKNLPYSFFK